MRSSHATWVFVAIVAAATCIQTGCGFTRLGKNVGNVSMKRPKLIGWRKDKPDTEIASATRPPSSSIPPGGSSTSGSGSRSFPSEPAPSGNYNYAITNTGGGDYSAPSGAGGNYGQSGGYNDTYVAGASASGGGESGAQRGFYDPDYGNTAGGGSQYGSTAGANQYGNTGPRGGSNDTYGGTSSDYGPSYGGSGTRNYEQVADRRGDSYDNTYGGSANAGASYGDTSGQSQYGGSQYGDAQYGGDQYGDAQYGAGQYNTQGDAGSRFVSPSSGGGNVDDYRSPSEGAYNGGGYDSTYGSPATTGRSSAPVSTGSSPRWLPGSTKSAGQYDQQQQLAPPTNGGWGR